MINEYIHFSQITTLLSLIAVTLFNTIHNESKIETLCKCRVCNTLVNINCAMKPLEEFIKYVDTLHNKHNCLL